MTDKLRKHGNRHDIRRVAAARSRLARATHRLRERSAAAGQLNLRFWTPADDK